MYTKKILSAAAAVAVMSTGAMAFDTNSTGGLLKYNEDANTITRGTYSMTNIDNGVNVNGEVNGTNLRMGTPCQMGDALIYPAFYSSNGWKSTFSVVNNSKTHAVVAKVVLYGREASKELKDFNIYLSANDVFRATIADGTITSTDGSTVVEGTDRTTTVNGARNDTVTMASEDTPFSTSLDEPAGYIAVYAMLETNTSNLTVHGSSDDVNSTTTDAALITAGKVIDIAYHEKHLNLWKDYRKLLDRCRSDNWREGINGGIYTDDRDFVAGPVINMGLMECSGIVSTQDANENGIADGNMSFTPPSNLLSGSILVGGDDSRGTRNMLLQARPLINFTPGDGTVATGTNDQNVSILWTEGEFASLADRCIESNGTRIEYNSSCIARDSRIFDIQNVMYEFSDAENSQIIFTQPLKRTTIQLAVTSTVGAWKEVARATPIAGLHAGMVTYYGGFKLGATIYNDDETRYDPATGGFTVSPATTPTTLIPNELSAFNPIPDTSGYTDGFARLDLTRTRAAGIPAIITQMSASKIGDTVETNWIHSMSNAELAY